MNLNDILISLIWLNKITCHVSLTLSSISINLYSLHPDYLYSLYPDYLYSPVS